ncbi:hypothetical protein DY000_02031017 [Brassica cretica]|uniref:V-type proton ATPase subunit a n=1 Tax=Brassica cretica TaxID=69181 RepID=A0ABQ7DVT5_BRACR|nr:hypothetical protein DY000_02031017 [Brassica cretica]
MSVERDGGRWSKRRRAMKHSVERNEASGTEKVAESKGGERRNKRPGADGTSCCLISMASKQQGKLEYNDNAEVKLGELEVGLSEINVNSDKLQHFYNELVEYKLLLDKAGDFWLQPEVLPLNREQSVGPTKQVKLGFLIALVPRDTQKSMVLERILFRAARSNIFIGSRQCIIEEFVVDPLLASVEKASFLFSTLSFS